MMERIRRLFRPSKATPRSELVGVISVTRNGEFLPAIDYDLVIAWANEFGRMPEERELEWLREETALRRKAVVRKPGGVA